MEQEYFEPLLNEEQKRANMWSKRVIGAAIEVHRHLGPGLLESAYEVCLCRELEMRGIPFRRQVPLLLEYKGIYVECAYRMDILVDEILILELKAIDSLDSKHSAQLKTYLRLTDLWLGLLLNFNEERLKNGIGVLFIDFSNLFVFLCETLVFFVLPKP